MINADYLAGLIDGEGYLALLPVRSKEVKNFCFEPVIKIGMTGEESLRIFNDIISIYGGYVEKRSKSSKGGRVVYTYLLKSKKKVHALLEDITDNLYVKHKQAVLLKEYCNNPSIHTKYNNYDANIAKRNVEIYHLLKKLKQPPAETN